MLFWILLGVFVLTMVIALIIVARRVRNVYRFDRDDAGMALFGTGAISIMVLGMIFSFVGLAAFSGEGAHNRPDDTYETVRSEPDGLKALALDTRESSSGVVFLFVASWGSSEDTIVQFVRQESDGGMVVDELDLNDARIFEDATEETANIVTVNYVKDASWYSPFGDTFESYDTDYEFHVPAGTVVQSYDIDITEE